MSQTVVVLLAFLMAVPVLASPLAADRDGGYISGFVKDSRGTPLGGVLVTLLEGTFNPRVVKKVTTDGSGRFEIKDLLPGSYALSVSLASYLPMLRPGIEVVAGKMARLNLSLQNLYQQALFPDLSGERSVAHEEDIRAVLRTASSTRPILRFGESDRQLDMGLDLESPNPAVRANQGWRGSVYVYSTAYSADPDYPDLGGTFTEFVFVRSPSANTRWLVAGTVSEGGFTEVDSMIKWRDLNGHSPSLRVSLGTLPYLDKQAHATQGHLQRLNLFNLDFEDEVALSEMFSAFYGLELQTTDPSVKARPVRPRWGFRMRPLPASQVSFLRTKSMPRLYRTIPSVTGEDLSFASPFQHEFGSKLRLGQTELTHTEMTVDRELDDQSQFAIGVYSDEFSPGRSAVQNGSQRITPIAAKGLRVAYKRSLGQGTHTNLGYTFGGGAQAVGETLDLVSKNYHVMVARLETQLSPSRTQVAATYRWISGVSVTVIDPYQEFFESSAPGLSLMVSQAIPYLGRFIPGDLEAQLDVHNLFDQHRVDSFETAGKLRHSEFLQPPRSVRGGIKLKF